MGSSPLTRGKQAASRGCCVAARLIPANAGKTFCVPAIRAWTRAHPHSRGENTTKKRSVPIRTGSSPLTRGKLDLLAIKIDRDRLIPAHAGKTALIRSGNDTCWVHPHSRGENDEALLPIEWSTGSSPLTWEKPNSVFFGRYSPWLIPAYGGKTPGTRPRLRSASAHPHSREENVMILVLNCLVAGSFPLTRGKHIHCHPLVSRRGLIPAHAGKTPRG